MDTSTTSQDDRVTVRLSDSCIENPTAFMSTLSYGSCPDHTTFQESKPFSNSNTALFELDVNSVTGVLCIQVEVTHQSQPNRLLNTLEQQLSLKSCSMASNTSVASCSVTVEFSLAGRVPHGTIATFKPLSNCTDRLVGTEHATCFNGVCSSSVLPCVSLVIHAVI